MQQTTQALLLSSTLTLALAIENLPLAVGFASVGVLGAFVGHARYTLEREKQTPPAAELTAREHACMLMRGVLMAEFVCLVLLLAWLEMRWAWTWGLIVAAISSVFATDAIELMWRAVRARFLRITDTPS